MQIRIERLQHLPTATLGSLFIDNVWECFTSEPPLRADRVFVACESPLPADRYNVSLTISKRYARVVPLCVGPRMQAAGGHRIALGMRIVPGRYTLDTDLGIVVGQTQSPKDVHQTRQAYDALFEKLEAAQRRSEAIDLDITSPLR